jgi:hypothetical protein
MKRLLLVLAVCGLMVGFLSVQNASAGLIVNGGFETGTVGAAPPSPWSSIGGVVEQIQTSYPKSVQEGWPVGSWFTTTPYEGTRMAEMKFESDQTLQQIFNVPVGGAGMYTITFWYNLYDYDYMNNGESGPDYFSALIDGNTLLAPVPIDAPVGTVSSTGWTQFAGDVYLGEGSHTLRFFGDLNASSAASYFYVDAVDVNLVPVPAAVWLLGSGLIGLVGLRRRFRK